MKLFLCSLMVVTFLAGCSRHGEQEISSKNSAAHQPLEIAEEELQEADLSSDGSIAVYDPERDYEYLTGLIQRSFPRATHVIPLDDNEIISKDDAGNKEVYEQLIFVKLVEQRPVGFVRLFYKDLVFYIIQSAVDEAQRHKGYGTQLVNVVINLAHKSASSVAVTVRTDTPNAHSILKNAGFGATQSDTEFIEYFKA